MRKNLDGKILPAQAYKIFIEITLALIWLGGLCFLILLPNSFDHIAQWFFVMALSWIMVSRYLKWLIDFIKTRLGSHKVAVGLVSASVWVFLFFVSINIPDTSDKLVALRGCIVLALIVPFPFLLVYQWSKILRGLLASTKGENPLKKTIILPGPVAPPKAIPAERKESALPKKTQDGTLKNEVLRPMNMNKKQILTVVLAAFSVSIYGFHLLADQYEKYMFSRFFVYFVSVLAILVGLYFVLADENWFKIRKFLLWTLIALGSVIALAGLVALITGRPIIIS